MNKKNKKIMLLVCFIIVIIIILYFLYTYINKYKYKYTTKESLENQRKIWAMSFGGGGHNFIDAVNRVSSELSQINVFDKIIAYTDADLKKDTEFWNKHQSFIENNKRGYGYWIWKPYLIKQTLNQMNDDDILIYVDAGCEIANKQDSNEKMNNLIDKCNTHNMLYANAGHDSKSYTKMDLVKSLNINMDNNIIMNTNMHQAGVIILKKSKQTVAFITDWYNISCDDYHLSDDSPSILQNDASFIEHRHDQAIFSLLLKTDAYTIFNTNNNIIDDITPIITSRRRSG